MKLPSVTIIDYGVGNLLSVQRGFEKCGARVNLTSDPKEILDAKRVVLPGVGAFANAMEALNSFDLISVVKEIGKRNTPLLGICLGMELLLDESNEFGVTKGLGLIPGYVTSIPTKQVDGTVQKIPHIGWSSIQPSSNYTNWNDSILSNNRYGDSMYFVHSFMAVPSNQENRIADCDYGGHNISAVISKGNITGCQFHPEKSGETGLKILSQFAFSELTN
jgi:glutamine amidotransferase